MLEKLLYKLFRRALVKETLLKAEREGNKGINFVGAVMSSPRCCICGEVTEKGDELYGLLLGTVSIVYCQKHAARLVDFAAGEVSYIEMLRGTNKKLVKGARDAARN